MVQRLHSIAVLAEDGKVVARVATPVGLGAPLEAERTSGWEMGKSHMASAFAASLAEIAHECGLGLMLDWD